MTNENLQLSVLEILLKDPSSESPRLDIHAKTFNQRKLIRKLHARITVYEHLEIEANVAELREAKVTIQQLSEAEVNTLIEDILVAYGKK
ncbi:hypothetical protein GHI93_01020 [Lactococcus hircilactis]|uniref:Uncharacterized protein n=1 Tax=Lactococcus hircilactis TaxID=1494462 RepID=A0A7X1Z6J7_9LACT|nr:hypothetical protein [Lactococcus hircilactis]MQW38531.1 hypothetical protein [Lactococcus hircilactis]